MGNTEIFNSMASEYDTEERIHIAKIAADAIRESLNGADNKKAIDFGCGTGLVGMHLLNDFKTVLFMDSSENMINQIKQKISEHNIQNADTLYYDVEKETSLDLHVDYIFMAQVLLHIKDIKIVLERLFHILNVGGHLIIVDFDKNANVASDLVHNGFDQEELIKRMNQIGFSKNYAKTFYNGSKIFMNQDASLFILDAQK